MDLNSILGSLVANVFENLAHWNIVLIILGACSLISMGIFIERMLLLRRSETNIQVFMPELRTALSKNNIKEAKNLCQKSGGTVANIISAGLEKYNRGREQIQSAMEVKGMTEIAHLERNAKILSIIAHIAPLIGLLGTVLGFIQAFSEMRTSGMMDITTTRIGSAMEYALETTAAGLVVAIPSVVAYNYIVSRIEGFLLQIQSSSSEVLDLLVNEQESGG